jgi:hypothetical protein
MVAAGMPSVEVFSVPNLTWTLPTNAFCINEDSLLLTGVNVAGGTFSGPGVFHNGTFLPLAAGGGPHTLTYTYQTATGCEVTTSVQVTVQPAPSVSFNISDICIAAPPTPLSGGFPFNGDYFINGVPATTIYPGNYAVGDSVEVSYAIVSGVCTSVATRTVRILAAPPKPTVTVTWGTLTCDQVGYDYQWFDIFGNAIPGATNQVFTPTTPGTYTVQLSINGTCGISSSPVSISTVSTESVLDNALFKLYPNPNTGVFKISYLGTGEDVVVKIYNAAGQVVFEKTYLDTYTQQEREFQLDNLASGVYTLQLIQREAAASHRFTIR